MEKEKLTALLLVLVLLLSGCASSPPSGEPKEPETLVVTDVYGRQVEVPKKIETIETIAAIGGAHAF